MADPNDGEEENEFLYVHALMTRELMLRKKRELRRRKWEMRQTRIGEAWFRLSLRYGARMAAKQIHIGTWEEICHSSEPELRTNCGKASATTEGGMVDIDLRGSWRPQLWWPGN